MSRTSIPRNAASARAAFNNGGWVTAGSRGKIARQLGDDELTAAMKNTDDEAVIIPVPKGTDTSGWKKLALADLIGPHGPNSMRNRQPPKPTLRFDSQVRSSGRKRTFDEANQPTMSVQLRKQKPEVTKHARTNQWDALRALSDEAEKAEPLPTILQNAWDGELTATSKKSSKPATGWAKAAAASTNKTVFVPHGVIDELKVVGAQPKSKKVSWKQHLCTWSDAYAKTRSRSPSPSPPPSRGSWWSDDEMDTDDVEAEVVGAIYA